MTVFAQTQHSIFLVVVCAWGVAACGSDAKPESPAPFELQFAALVDGHAVGCSDDLYGFGPSGDSHLGINDLRFYLSNPKFKDAEGREVEVVLDENEFQYASPDGAVALIDLTGNSEGSCSASSVAYAEGTARTHLALTGTTRLHQVSSVSFDVGVPQSLMKKTIATDTPEGAPSPLNEMYWNWNTGYRHFVFNFSVRDDTGATGAGYVHLGSRDCAPTGDGIKALEDRDACTFINTPSVALDSFDLDTDAVGVDLRKIVDGVDFIAPTYDSATFEVIGEGPGVECHSSPMEPDCTPVFGSFGLDMTTGAADAQKDSAFVKIAQVPRLR